MHLLGLQRNVIAGTKRAIPSGQYRSILPARVANHSAGFGSSCPLAELAILLLSRPNKGITTALTRLVQCSGLLVNQNNRYTFVLLSVAVQKEPISVKHLLLPREQHVLCRFARVRENSATSYFTRPSSVALPCDFMVVSRYISLASYDFCFCTDCT